MLQAVFSIPFDKRGCAASLFPEPNGLMRACLDGCMGQAFGDHPSKPQAAVMCVGDFAILGGNYQSAAARHLTGKLALEKGKTWYIPAVQGWAEHIAFWKPQKMEHGTRYAMETCEPFDKEKLQSIAGALAPDVVLRPIDASLYLLAMQEPWSRDWCSQFDDATDYACRGIGVAALMRGELVAGASSYVVYNQGIEIQTDAREDMRRQGLAGACCAQLILDCLAKGIQPSWDAANIASLLLAQKLGYVLKKRYDIWEVVF